MNSLVNPRWLIPLLAGGVFSWPWVILTPRLAGAQASVVGEVSGEVAVQRDGLSAVASNGMALQPGDVLTAESGSGATLAMSGGNQIRLRWDTSIEVGQVERGAMHVRLKRGSIVAETKMPDSLVVETTVGPVATQSAGTYQVDADPARNFTEVRVRTGVAQMAGQNIFAGERANLGAAGLLDLHRNIVRGGSNSAAWVVPTGEPPLPAIAVHEANAAKAAAIVQQANNPESGKDVRLAPVHEFVPPPIIESRPGISQSPGSPHGAIPIGLPPSGIGIVH